MRRILCSLCFLSLVLHSGDIRAQQLQQAHNDDACDHPAGQVELFCGAELNYADINYLRLYDVLINLTPSVKWHLGHDWQVSGQVFLPFVNEGYAKRYEMIRLNMANVSKEFHFDKAHQHFKLTAGLFGMERYGADLRWMYPINSWLMVNARVGLVNHWALGFDLHSASESEFATGHWSKFGIAGASIWLDQWATELRATGGHYMNDDYGVEGEIIRHFRHCSVSVFAQRHERYQSTGGSNVYSGGFRVVMMIPPYKKSRERVVFRPASNFRLTYNAQSDGYSMKKYNTDPEENERTQPMRLPWGTGNFNE